MEASCLFSLLLGTNWLLFLWNYYLQYRQFKVHKSNEKRPIRIEALITEEEYEKARNYKLDKHAFNFAHDIFSQTWTSVVLIGGWLPWVWYTCSTYSMPSVMFMAVTTLVDTIIDLPWDLYDTFVVEEKHGFNKQTLGFYAKDKVKKILVSLAIMTPVILIVEWIVENGGEFGFIDFLNFLFCSCIFSAERPILFREAIEKLAASVKFPLTKLYVVYGSKRSAHSNAYMYGFWNNKRIVLYDTLLSGDEKEKVMKECAEAAEEMTEKDKVTEVLMSIHSRRCEFAADEFAAKLGYGDLLASSLVKLGKDNLVLPIDDPLYSMCNHSHPPIPERIEAINRMKLK
ncbi:unnamed protein product [Nippostrongylus brasiliensis]|uniref:CAAX prenyl protease n=1 Tax=Nippostrongylus brasiliensis TaxID=27835 RepID=A0A158R2B8_NIPBR|nr:unnamed protein product [Nippostrongylus brasiliensis]